MLCQAEAFPHHPPQPIALDGIACRFHCHRQTHPRMPETIRLDAKSKKTVVEPATASIDRIELQLASQPQVRAETKRALR